jgi:hypothetical protein
LYNYKNKVSFSIKPRECLIILPKSYALTNEMSFEIQYCVNENQIKLCNKDICYLCFWIMNSDNQVELYVEEGTSLAALLEQSEIDYSLVHMPLSNLESYFNNQHLSETISNSRSSSSSSSTTSGDGSINNDENQAQTLRQQSAEDINYKSCETDQFDAHVIANACINAANAAATAAAAAATIVKSFAHNK